jgi:hypothetical protein
MLCFLFPVAPLVRVANGSIDMKVIDRGTQRSIIFLENSKPESESRHLASLRQIDVLGLGF